MKNQYARITRVKNVESGNNSFITFSNPFLFITICDIGTNFHDNKLFSFHRYIYYKKYNPSYSEWGF